MFANHFLRLLIFIIVLSLFGCNNPLQFLHQEIINYGYIPYPTPLEFSGPGTLVGGSPQQMNLIASPATCFPYLSDGEPTNLRRVDHTTIPRRNYSVKVSGKNKLDLFNFLKTGGPSIRAGFNIEKVHTIELDMQGVHIEYLDSIALTDFYREKMSQTCKDYLNKVGFIIQAIKVEKLNFSFYEKKGGKIQITVNNINEIVDISSETQWDIENNTSLIINTPKYVGYQLGSLRQKNNGLALYRASLVKNKKYKFTSINVFENSDNRDDDNVDGIEFDDLEYAEAPIFMRTITQADELSQYADYKK